ncbi:unnamed protein product [Prunus armeniaca]|uniref:Uncharacterized protein n=1 Tax=Prunus armeniaca TaxID=36596 RepID=A0A6J5X185_PRUAR|nr:unnamed protein product [Prunus armeniaca]
MEPLDLVTGDVRGNREQHGCWDIGGNLSALREAFNVRKGDCMEGDEIWVEIEMLKLK